MRAAVFIFFCVLFGLPISATNLYVSVAGTNDTPPFTNWPLSCSNIQWVVNAAASNDTVWVSNGTYYLTNQISITKSITVQGYTNNGIVTVDGQTYGRCFYVYHTNAVLDGFNIINGWTNAANGGGIYLGAGTVQSCTLFNNRATNGAGIYIPDTDVNMPCIVRNCTLSSNIALSVDSYGGGGIFTASGKLNVLIDGCLIQNNHVWGGRGGGGINFYSGLLCNSTIISNTALGCGGGVVSCGSSIVSNCLIAWNICSNAYSYSGGGVNMSGGRLVNCTIRNNRSGYGGYGGAGGIFAESSAGGIGNCIITSNEPGGIYNFWTPTISNCLIAYNYTSGSGGGISMRRGAVTKYRLVNCTIVSNYAGTIGGGYYGADNTTTVVVENTIIYLNTCSTGSNYYNVATTYFTNSCTAPTNDLLGTNNISSNPAFVNKDAGNWHLTGGSPCVNSGTNEAWMNSAADLDGRRRLDFFNGIVDMGCYEYLPSGSMYRFGF
jgi:hypothetical protein